jgi:hypothetical protein
VIPTVIILYKTTPRALSQCAPNPALLLPRKHKNPPRLVPQFFFVMPNPSPSYLSPTAPPLSLWTEGFLPHCAAALSQCAAAARSLTVPPHSPNAPLPAPSLCCRLKPPTRHHLRSPSLRRRHFLYLDQAPGSSLSVSRASSPQRAAALELLPQPESLCEEGCPPEVLTTSLSPRSVRSCFLPPARPRTRRLRAFRCQAEALPAGCAMRRRAVVRVLALALSARNCDARSRVVLFHG